MKILTKRELLRWRKIQFTQSIQQGAHTYIASVRCHNPAFLVETVRSLLKKRDGSSFSAARLINHRHRAQEHPHHRHTDSPAPVFRPQTATSCWGKREVTLLRDCERRTDRLSSRKAAPRPHRQGKAASASARRFVSDEARTLKSRRPARHVVVPLSLSFSPSFSFSSSYSTLSASPLHPSSQLPFCSRLAELHNKLLFVALTGAHSSPILRIASYLLCLAFRFCLFIFCFAGCEEDATSRGATRHKSG